MTSADIPAHKRLDDVDLARGVAILFVVLGHAIQFTDEDFDGNSAFRFIYAVHMPLFMFISGMVAQIDNLSTHDFVRRRARSLLVPFLAWLPLCWLAITYIQRPHGFSAGFGEFLLGVAKSPDAGGLWFLLVLFECQAVLHVCTRCAPSRPYTAAFGVLVLLNMLLTVAPSASVLGLGLLRWHLLFFLLGKLARENDVLPHRAHVVLACAVAFAVLASYWYRKSAVPIEWLTRDWPVAARRFATQGYHAVTALSGIAAILGGCRIAVAKPMAIDETQWHMFVVLGRRTLDVYAAHYPFLYAAVGLSAGMGLPLAARTLMVFCVALCGALYVSSLICRSRFGSLLLLGRST